MIIKKLKVNVKDNKKLKRNEFKSTLFVKTSHNKIGKDTLSDKPNIKIYKTDIDQISDDFEFDSYRYSYSLEV